MSQVLLALLAQQEVQAVLVQQALPAQQDLLAALQVSINILQTQVLLADIQAMDNSLGTMQHKTRRHNYKFHT
jgi:hypothetical protein